jgi:hypothetical protein
MGMGEESNLKRASLPFPWQRAFYYRRESGRFGNSNNSRFGAKQGFGFRRQRDANAETKHGDHYRNNIEFHITPFITQLWLFNLH